MIRTTPCASGRWKATICAKYVAKTVTNELEIYYRAVEEMAASSRFQTLLETTPRRPRNGRAAPATERPAI